MLAATAPLKNGVAVHACSAHTITKHETQLAVLVCFDALANPAGTGRRHRTEIDYLSQLLHTCTDHLLDCVVWRTTCHLIPPVCCAR